MTRFHANCVAREFGRRRVRPRQQGCATQGCPIPHCPPTDVTAPFSATKRQQVVTQFTFRVPRFFRSLEVPPASGDGGFLPDVETEIGRAFAKESRRLEDLLGYRCLVILGEPGIGKSTVMEERKKLLPADAAFHDLRFELPRNVLASEALQRWQTGAAPLHLVIDSLDESSDPHFPNQLFGALRTGPAETLSLEVACRTGEWPPILRQRLPEVFDPASIGYFQVEPLRRRDVRDICRARGLDGTRFLDLVSERDLQPLARSPLTLGLLLDLFAQSEMLPRRLRELYEQACLLLCDERSPSRQSAGTVGTLTPHERLDVGSTLAAASAFSRRPVLVMESSGLSHAGLVSVDDVLRTTGAQCGPRVAAREVLGSGLFASRGAGRWGWSHQTYAEYLAARWAMSARLNAHQLRQLLLHHENVDTLVPQLLGVAAWLAAFSPEVVALLAEHAPEFFIASDSELATDAQRVRATDQILKRAEDLTLRRHWASATEYRRLGHPDLAAQLEPFIRGESYNPLTRRIALDIAKANRLSGLFELLCGVAFDRSTAAAVRADAVEAAIEAGRSLPPHELIARLRSLAEPDDETDPNEDVRAAVLEWLWPGHMSAAELFRLLTVPRRSHYFGRYEGFISQVAGSLTPEHLVDGLRWVERNALRHSSDDCLSFERLSGKICRMAVGQVHRPDVLVALALAAQRRLSVYRTVFHGDEDDAWTIEDAPRRALVQAIIELDTASLDDLNRLFHPHAEAPFVQERDIEWLLEAWQRSEAPRKALWGNLVNGVVGRRTQTGTLEAVLQIADDSRVCELLPFPRWIDLGSPEEQTQRKWQAKEREWSRQQEAYREKARAKEVIDIEEPVQRTLAGDNGAWLSFVLRATRQADRGRAGLAEALDFDALSEEQRRRLTEAARQFVLRSETAPERWLRDHDQVYYAAQAGYATLRLLLENDSEWWCRNRAELSARWAAAVLSFPTYRLVDEEDRSAHTKLIADVFDGSPGHAGYVLQRVLARPYERGLSLQVLRHLPPRSEVADALERRARMLTVEPAELGDLLECLLQVERDSALRVSAALLARRPRRYDPMCSPKLRARGRPKSAHGWRMHAREGATQHKVETCIRLLDEGSNDAVKLVWDSTSRDQRLATQVWRRFPDRHLRAPWGAHVDTDVLGALYAWLHTHVTLPAHKNSDEEFFDDQLQFRLRLLDELSSRGTEESIAVLRKLLRAFPDDANLRSRSADANERYYENSWRPVAPNELFELARSANRRVVQSSPQLLECVLDALERYEAELRAETPAAMDIWSYKTVGQTKVYWPKDENDFSDHLKRFLQRELTDVLVNREVEIRPSEGARKGERTDLLVQATNAETRERAEVVIEVKGSWNPDLETDLEQQLVNRYLTGGALRCGIYLIGWFASTSWDSSDWRRQATERRDKDSLTDSLRARAKGLSIGGRLVAVRVINTGFD